MRQNWRRRSVDFAARIWKDTAALSELLVFAGKRQVDTELSLGEPNGLPSCY